MQSIGNHPNLLEFIGCYEGDNTFYVAMGLIEGNSLYNEIKKRKEEKFPMHQIKSFIKQIISGVQHYQKVGVMHRDLKPENIMFKKRESLDELVIVDFGLGEFENTPQYLFSKCGTPGYVAPEVANYKEELKIRYTTKCDMFSVGVILHTLLYHSSVFYGKKFNEVLQKNKECKIDFTQKCYEKTSERTLNFMKGLLEKDPIKRFSAEQALKHEFLFDIDDDETLTNRKKAGSWNTTTPVLAQDEVQEQITESQSPTLPTNSANGTAKNLRKRASTSQTQFTLKTNNLNIPASNNSGGTAEAGALNSFNNVMSNEQMSTSFYHNVYNMFQANMTGSVIKGSSDAKSNNIQDSTNGKSIEIGSSPFFQPNSNPDMISSAEQKKQTPLNRVQEEEEDTESPNVRQKMSLHQRDFKIGILEMLEKQEQKEKINEAEKEFNNFLKQTKLNSIKKNGGDSNHVDELNESQEFDNSVDLSNEKDNEKIREKCKQLLDGPIPNQENNNQEIK